jgi:hypothetical protein
MPASRTRKPAKKTTSGNPANRTPSTAADFKKKAGSGGGSVELPSGNVVVINRVGLTTLLAEGLLADSLAGIAQQAVDKGKNIKPEEQQELMRDPAKIKDMLATFDKVVVMCWSDPKVLPAEGVKVDIAGLPLEDGIVLLGPNWRTARKDEKKTTLVPEGERFEDQLYADEIELMDKLFTFQYVSGGSSDLERFRQELGQSVDGVEDLAGLRL